MSARKWTLWDENGVTGVTDHWTSRPRPTGGVDVIAIPDLLEQLRGEEAREQIGQLMEDWAARMHGILASSHRPGRDDDGREAAQVITALINHLDLEGGSE